MKQLQSTLDRFWDRVIRAESLPGVQYTEPLGDPGWFGPDSAMWHVNAHTSAFIGAHAANLMQSLHPVIVAGTWDHTRMLTAEKMFDLKEARRREGRSVSFVLGATYGSSATAERVTRIVRTMHNRVVGTLPNGQPYSANDPDVQRYVHATFAHCMATAHVRYHPRPLSGADLDRYYADWAVISEALGARDLPMTKADTDDYFDSVLAELAPPPRVIDGFDVLESFLPPRLRTPVVDGTDLFGGFPSMLRRVTDLLLWPAIDLMPPNLAELFRPRKLSPVRKKMRRAIVRTLLGALEIAGGPWREVRLGHQRVQHKTRNDIHSEVRRRRCRLGMGRVADGWLRPVDVDC